MAKAALILAIIMSLACSTISLSQNMRRLMKSNMSWQQLKVLEVESESLPTKLIFSPDGMMLALADPQGTVFFWDTSSWQLVHKITESAGYPHDVGFSPDGKWIAIINPESRQITVYEATTWKKFQIVANVLPVSGIGFSPDGHFLAFATYVNREECLVKLYNTATGKEIRSMANHSNDIISIAFSPDGKLLATGSRDKTLKLWNLRTGRLIRAFQGKGLPEGMAHEGWVGGLAFSPDGKFLASGDVSLRSTIKLWDTKSGSEISKMLLSDENRWDQIQGLAFSPDGELLAASSIRKVAIFDVNAWKEVWSLSKEVGEGGFAGATFSANGELFAFVNYPHRPNKANPSHIEIWQLTEVKKQ